MDTDDRATRLADALRSNLRRRKAQSREQRGADDRERPAPAGRDDGR